jgi:uncharacterized protein YceH (UPF0502 family)
VQAAIDHLKTLSLVMESSGGRVMRYAQNVARVLAIPAQSVALLTVIMLRGPQTVGELRIHSERLHRFADISSVEGFLAELAERASAHWWSSSRASPAPGRPLGAFAVRCAGDSGARPRCRGERRARCRGRARGAARERDTACERGRRAARHGRSRWSGSWA